MIRAERRTGKSSEGSGKNLADGRGEKAGRGRRR